MADKAFTIPIDPWDTGERIFRKSRIIIHPGITVLVGCNGAGKTTMIRFMKQELDKQAVSVISFDNLHDGGANARSAAGFYGDIGFLATAIMSSEGENILMNMGQFAKKLGTFIRNNSDASELWVFLDAVDSGFSIDNIIDLKRFLRETVLDSTRDKDVYIVIAANAYEFAMNESCFDVQSGLYVRFCDYEDYRNFVLETRAKKDARSKEKESNDG